MPSENGASDYFVVREIQIPVGDAEIARGKPETKQGQWCDDDEQDRGCQPLI